MTELLDALEDSGVDHDTIDFLLESLTHAERSEWRDIVEPFVQPPDQVLKVLRSVPGVVERTVQVLAASADAEAAALAAKEEAARASSRRFIEALQSGLQDAMNLYQLAVCSQVSRDVLHVSRGDKFWELRVQRACGTWGAPRPAKGPWHRRFFSVLRPRCDGIYIGECGYSKERTGVNLMEARGMTSRFIWCDYRRYLRLFPPLEDGSCWALIFRDACPRGAGEEILMDVDPRTHVNPDESEGRVATEMRSSAAQANATREQLTARVCAGRYEYSPEEGAVRVTFVSAKEEYCMEFELTHGRQSSFCSHLRWLSYRKAAAISDALDFDLGYKENGCLRDEAKNHFQALEFRPHKGLRHLL